MMKMGDSNPEKVKCNRFCALFDAETLVCSLNRIPKSIAALEETISADLSKISKPLAAIDEKMTEAFDLIGDLMPDNIAIFKPLMEMGLSIMQEEVAKTTPDIDNNMSEDDKAYLIRFAQYTRQLELEAIHAKAENDAKAAFDERFPDEEQLDPDTVDDDNADKIPVDTGYPFYTKTARQVYDETYQQVKREKYLRLVEKQATDDAKAYIATLIQDIIKQGGITDLDDVVP